MNTTTYALTGMTCQHCVQSVHTKLATVSGVERVEVQLMPPRAHVTGTADAAQLQQALAGSQFGINKL